MQEIEDGPGHRGGREFNQPGETDHQHRRYRRPRQLGRGGTGLGGEGVARPRQDRAGIGGGCRRHPQATLPLVLIHCQRSINRPLSSEG